MACCLKGRRWKRFWVVLVAWCVGFGGSALPAEGQFEESVPIPSVPPIDVVEGLVAGQVIGFGGVVDDGFVGVEAVSGVPPLDGDVDEDLGRLDESGLVGGGMGQQGEPGPTAEVFEGGFLEAPVEVEPEEGPAPEGFGGLAMCAGGFVCGSAPQILPGPTGLSCSVTASVIVFSWNAVSGADNYTAKLQLAVAGSAQTERHTSGTSVVFAGLSSSTKYYIGVHSNVGGAAQYYSGVYCTTAVGPPLCGLVSATAVSLYWKADTRVHQWFVGRATSGNQYVDGRSVAGSTLYTVFSGLEANVSYRFFFWWRASSSSSWKQVHPSRVCSTIAPPVAPPITCTATASSVSIRWGSVRGAVRYRVSRGSGWATASGSSHTFSNLSESTAYTVRVQGGNSAGWGDSGTATCRTMASLLSAPTGLRCEATSSQIRLSWNAVAGASGYSAKIQLVQPGSTQTDVRTSATSATFAGLQPSTRYWVSVLALKNSEPQQFAGVYCITLVAIAAPTLSCTATSSSVTVSWPRVTGATKYRARVGSGAWTADFASTSYTFTGLAAGVMHTVTVQAGASGGWGSAASVRCVTAAQSVSCDDTTSNSVLLEWDDRADADYWYAAISRGTGYFSPRYADRQINEATSTLFTGLDKDTRYVMLLWWYDGSNWNQTIPPPECHTKALDTPNVTEYATGGNTLSIQWNPVDRAQRYQVQITPIGTRGTLGTSQNNQWETVVSTGTFHTFTNLVPNTQYTVRLRAINAQNQASAIARLARYTSPARCKAVTATTITLAWQDPDEDYQWRIRRKVGENQYTNTSIHAKGTSTETTVTGLTANTEYSFSVERRASSTEPWEHQNPFPHCHTSPASPTITQCPQAADVDGTIRWTPNGAHYYRITLNKNQTNPVWIITNSNAHTYSNLVEGTTYNIAVQARNPQGWSTSSDCNMKTLPPIPNNLITGTGTYYFTEGTIKGVLYAAETAINDYATANLSTWNSCKSTIDKTKLAAIMLSIPPGEVINPLTSATANSPMTLGRSDNFTIQVIKNSNGIKASLNLRTYSHTTVEDYLRAHWSPAVGPWQLDNLGDDIKFNHAERADITKGGKIIASFLRDSHCSNPNEYSGLRSVLNSRWYGCSPEKEVEDKEGNKSREEILDACYNRYIINSNRIYRNGTLNIQLAQENSQKPKLDQVDGGINERVCRWSSDLVPMPCYLYDTGKPQGAVMDSTPNGGPPTHHNPFTPYPSAFISLTEPATSTKYAVWPSKWPTSSSLMPWPTEVVSASFAIYRAVRADRFVRCSPGHNPIKNQGDSEGTCHGETYAPFGIIKVKEPTVGDPNVEGWFDGSIPYLKNGTDKDYHRLQVEACSQHFVAQVAFRYCWWEDV